MHTLIQDIRFALRQLRRAPAFAASVVIVLALGIGANAAMFTVLESTLFKPLAFRDPARLIRLNVTGPDGGRSGARIADLAVWQQRSHTVSSIAAFNEGQGYLITPSTQLEIEKTDASANLFHTLGAAPALGRTFTADEQQPGRQHVAVLSDFLWRTQFHADQHILGQTVRIDHDVVTVIGVMPRGFVFPDKATTSDQLWMPTSLTPQNLDRNQEGEAYSVIGRIAPGITPVAAQAELDAIQQQILPLYTGPNAIVAPAHVDAVDYRRSLYPQDQRAGLLALLGSVAALWLIACANVASLMLARTAARRREMAIRSALGATRWRITRQTLAESLLLSLIGGAIGLALSQLLLTVLQHSLTTQLGVGLILKVDGRVILALLALSLVSAVLFGAVPAALASRHNLEQSLRQDGAQSGTGRHQHRLQRTLVVGEISLTIVMLVSCGLLLRTVFALRQVPLGFRTDHVLVLSPHLPGYKYDQRDANTLVYTPLLERLKQLPGVDSAAITTIAPLAKGFAMEMTLSFSKFPGSLGSGQPISATMRAAGPELQQVLHFTMDQGRYFGPQDTAESQPVAVVNRAFAKLYEASATDIGKFQIGDGKRTFKIVGVVSDFHQTGIADPAMPEIDLNSGQIVPTEGFYQPTLQAHVQLVLRSTRDTGSLIPELDRVLAQVNPDLAGTPIRTMDQVVDDAIGSQLLAAHLLELLGGLALLVSLTGLYSLMAYLVTLRTRELGLRLALGAQRSDNLSLILRSAGGLLLGGTALGVLLSLAATRFLHSFLFGVTRYDTLTLVMAPILLSAVGILATLLPARRAASVNPTEALRTE